MDSSRAIAWIAQLLCLVWLVQGVLALEKLKRFIKAARPDLWEKIGVNLWQWLRYSFSSADMQQPNIRRLKGTLWIHFAAASSFWLISLAARLGFLEALLP